MDFLATKGLEYLLVLGYLALLIPFWHLLSARRASPARVSPRLPAPDQGWFAVPEGYHFHRGHTWAFPESRNLLRVGMDDFAHRLLGPVDRVELPPPGRRLEAGHEGWKVHLNGTCLPILSPVTGIVEAVNQGAGAEPTRLGTAPYEEGWLLRVAVPSAEATLNNLMPDQLARTWTESESAKLGFTMDDELGAVLQDGGEPLSGLAIQLAGEDWPTLAARTLLSPRTAADPGVRDTPEP